MLMIRQSHQQVKKIEWHGARGGVPKSYCPYYVPFKTNTGSFLSPFPYR